MLFRTKLSIVLLFLAIVLAYIFSTLVRLGAEGDNKDIVNLNTRLVQEEQSSRDVQPESHQETIQYDKLISGDRNETDKAEYLMDTHPKFTLMDEAYPHLTHNCSKYIESRGYFTQVSSSEEEDFPIAFSMLVYKHLEQVERLLRAVWRPTNVYCISVDAKSSEAFTKGVYSITKCFDNVFLHPERLDIKWGTPTVLFPELLCMKLMWGNKKNWKYFINLTGQEFPLKTNYELVQILKAYNGANDIDGTWKNSNPGRWTFAGPPPHGMMPRKGSVHIIASRGYVDYILHNETADDLLEWVVKTVVPDEAFFTMLNFNPHLKVPGSFKGDVDDEERQYLGRFKQWYSGPGSCLGAVMRRVCIMQVQYLPDLVTAPELFVNKFLYDHHPIAYDCLEEWYRHKVALELQGELDFNTTLYKNRKIVTHHF